MTYWQENYAFIKDVYDSRSSKLEELMEKTDNAISAVLADKIYTSNEFKKIQETFMGLARNLEQPETKEWLTITKDTLMSDRERGAETDEENKKLTALLTRFDATIPRISDTKNVVDCLWKAYQFTDELAPYMEFLEDMRGKSTRDINTNSSNETEEHIEKQEKYMDQIDKKKKTVMEQISKGEKILANPKSPKFLDGHVNKLRSLWDEANVTSEQRLQALRDNLSAWEKYEKQRSNFFEAVQEGNEEYKNIKKLYNREEGKTNYTQRCEAVDILKKSIQEIFKDVVDANSTLEKLLGDIKKSELSEEIEAMSKEMEIIKNLEEKLQNINNFNISFATYQEDIRKLDSWLQNGQKRLESLLKPDKDLLPEERVMLTMELQSDIEQEILKTKKCKEIWISIEPERDEISDDSQSCVSQQTNIVETQQNLLAKVKQEGEKFGEDVKHLADFASSQKKFTSWIDLAEQKKKNGLLKPLNLNQAIDLLTDLKNWREETESIKKTIDDGYENAKKMSSHDEPDQTYATCIKRWNEIKTTCEDWIAKLESMVNVWQKQAETAQKVTAAIAATPNDASTSEMKLEDLEEHLNSLRQMFIDKQKMMAELGEK